jgi:hypothetical protein
MFKYDTVHGRFKGEVSHTADSLVVNGKTIKVFNKMNVSEASWEEHPATLDTAAVQASRGISRACRCCPAVGQFWPVTCRSLPLRAARGDPLGRVGRRLCV